MRRKAVAIIASIGALAFIGGLGFEIVSETDGSARQVTDSISSSQAEAEPAAAAPAAAPATAPASGLMAPTASSTASEADEDGKAHLPEKEVIDEVKARREELEKRAHDLDAREAELKAKEKALEDEFNKIEQVRNDISKIDAARKKENEEKIAKLIETFEAMNPKAISQLLSNMDESLAVASMSKMSTAKLAKVLNVMETDKSSRLTELLAGVIKARSVPAKAGNVASSNGAGSITPNSTKGGETNGKTEQRANSSPAAATPPAAQGQPSGEKAGTPNLPK